MARFLCLELGPFRKIYIFGWQVCVALQISWSMTMVHMENLSNTKQRQSSEYPNVVRRILYDKDTVSSSNTQSHFHLCKKTFYPNKTNLARHFRTLHVQSTYAYALHVVSSTHEVLYPKFRLCYTIQWTWWSVKR